MIYANKLAILQVGVSRTSYLSKIEWDRVIQRLSNSEHYSRVLSNLSLGKPGWNVAEGRNVAHLLTLARPEWREVLWLDDDTVVPVHLDPALDANGGILGFPLSGCPDYGRTKWLMWFLAVISESFRRLCVSSGWWQEPSSDAALEFHRVLLHEYTDLHRYLDERTSCKDTAFLKFPLPHNACHGTAFATGAMRSASSLFPPIYNEDIYWFRRMKQLGASVTSASDPILHDRPTISLLDSTAHLFEEVGAICSSTLLLLRANRHFESTRVVSALAKQRRRNLLLFVSFIQRTQGERRGRQIKADLLELLQRVTSGLVDPSSQSWMKTTVDEFRDAEEVWDRVRIPLASDVARLLGELGPGSP